MSTPLSVKLGSLIDEFNLEVLRGAEGYPIFRFPPRISTAPAFS